MIVVENYIQQEIERNFIYLPFFVQLEGTAI